MEKLPAEEDIDDQLQEFKLSVTSDDILTMLADCSVNNAKTTSTTKLTAASVKEENLTKKVKEENNMSVSAASKGKARSKPAPRTPNTRPAAASRNKTVVLEPATVSA